MKRVIFMISIFIIAFVGFGLFLIARYDSGYIADLISGELSRQTGSPVLFASKPNLTLMPLGFEFGNLHWEKEVLGQGGVQQIINVSADGGFVGLAVSQLLSGKISLRDARVDNLKVEIVEKAGKKEQEKEEIIVTGSAKVTKAEKLHTDENKDNLPIHVIRLHVRHGTFIYRDVNGTQTRLGGLTVILENLFGKDKSGLHCNFDCSVEKKEGEIVLAGDIRIDGKLQYEHQLLSFSDSVAMFVPKAGPLPVKAGPLRLDFSGNHDFSINRLHLSDLTMSLGLSGVNGGKVSTKGEAVADFSNLEYTVKAVAGGVPVGALFEAFGQGRQFDATGTISVDLVTRGKDTSSLLSSLEGRGQFEMRNVLPLHSKNTFVKHTNQIGLQLPDRIDRLYAPFVVNKGEIVARPVTMSGNGFSGDGNAKISLPRQDINAIMDCKLAGVTIPVFARGSFSNIQWGIDQNFATKLPSNLADVISSTGNKAGNAGSSLFRKGHTAEELLNRLRQR